MVIVDPNIPNGRMTSAVGWKNVGMGVAATARWLRPATTVPPAPICTTVAVTLR